MPRRATKEGVKLDKIYDNVLYERMHVVVEMPQFVADVKAARVTDSERSAIIQRISKEPMSLRRV
jgi:hypothetical protein